MSLTRACLRCVAPLGWPRSVYKSDVECNSMSKWPNDLESQGQWPLFSIPAESIPGCMFGANFVILAQIYDELSCRQAEFPRILSQNDLEGQGQWPLFSITTKSIPWCMFGANLVISAQICDELSCGQGKVYGRTDGHGQRQYPFRLKGQGGKMSNLRLQLHIPGANELNLYKKSQNCS